MNDVCNSFSTVSIRGPCYNIYVECIAKKGDFDMYTVRFQLELSGSEKRFLSKSFFYANQMHNQLVRYATNRLNALFHDTEYVGARKAYGEAEFSKKKGSELSSSLSKI